MEQFDLSVVIPSYNEEKNIGETLKAVTDFLNSQKIKSEVIVVDPMSTDKTGAITESFDGKDVEIVHLLAPEACKRGYKGAAVKKGVLSARGNMIMFIDADNATPFEQVDKLIEKLNEGFDMVVGSRYIKGSQINPGRSLLRTLVSRGGNMLINFVLRIPLKDTRCGFKLFKKEPAKEIFKRTLIPTFGFDDEVFVLARKLGYKYTEVAIVWNDIEVQKGIKSTVHATDILKSFVEMGQIRMNLLKRKYNLK